MNIHFLILYINFLSFSICIIDLPIIIYNEDYPLPIYMNSNKVRILVSGKRFVFNTQTGKQISTASLAYEGNFLHHEYTPLFYDKYVHYRISSSNYIQIGSKYNGNFWNIKYSNIDSENEQENKYYLMIKDENILNNLNSISIIKGRISTNNINVITLNNNEIIIFTYSSTGIVGNQNFLIDDIQYLSCENKNDDNPITCVYSTSINVYMVLISNGFFNKELYDSTKIEGMSKSKGVRIYLNLNYFCSLTENSNYECVKFVSKDDNSFSYTIIKQILSDCSSDYKDFHLGSFSYNNELIACCSSKSNSINCQRISGNEKLNLFSIKADSSSFVRNVEINSNEFLITYQCGNNACLHFFFIPSCLNIDNFELNINEKKVLNFNDYLIRDTNTNYYINFIEFSDNGIFYINNTIINIKTNYLIDENNIFYFEHKSNSINDITIKYFIYIEESYNSVECFFTIKINLIDNYYSFSNDVNSYIFCESPCNSYLYYPINYFLNENKKFEKCYETCLQCNYNFISDDDYGCVSCNQNSYPIYNNDKICISDENYILMGYYLKNNLLYKCYESCETCSDGFDSFENNHNCLTCKNDYNFIYNSSNCINETYANNNQYFKIIIDGIYYYAKCHENCETCFNYGDDNNNNCSTCIEDYLFLDDTNNCLSKDLNNNEYIIKDNKIYKCYNNCLSCSENSLFINDQKCIQCKPGFYKVENTNNCFDISYTNNGYYLYNNILYKCDDNCKTCSNSPSSFSNNCLTCDNSNNLYLVNEINNCSSLSLLNKGYYLNNNILYKCYQNCLKCENTKNEINENNQYCIICKNDYYFKKNTQNCYFKDDIIPGYSLIDNEFQKCNENCKLCSISEENSNEINNGCIECKNENYLFINGTNNCIETEQMEEGYFKNNGKIYKCSEKCKTCDLDKDNCTKCNNDEGYYSILNLNKKQCLKKEELIVNEINAYFLNKENNEYFWDICYINCLSCNEKGNIDDNKCLSCKNDYILINNNCVSKNEENKINQKCNNSLYFLNDICYEICPENYYIYEKNKTCVNNCPENTTLNSAKTNCIDKIIYTNFSLYSFIESIEKTILSYSSEDGLIIGNNFSMQIYELNDTKIVNENAKEYGLSEIDMGDCSNYLKEYYNISNDNDLIMLKIDKNISNSPVNSVEYYVYDYYGNSIDLNLCSNYSITVTKKIINDSYINLELGKELSEEGYDIFNASDPFFNDICTPYTTNNKTDVTLSDRREDYYQNVSFCELGCEYNGINYENKEVICNCNSTALTKQYHTQLKDNFDNINNFIDDFKNIDMNKIKNSFVKGLSETNIIVVKCYNLFFSWKYDKINIGFWIMIGIIFICLILSIFFIKNGLNPIKNFLYISLPEDIKKNQYKKNKQNKKQEFERFNSDNLLNISNPPKKFITFFDDKKNNDDILNKQENHSVIYESKLNNTININNNDLKLKTCYNKFNYKPSKYNLTNSETDNNTVFVHKSLNNNFINDTVKNNNNVISLLEKSYCSSSNISNNIDEKIEKEEEEKNSYEFNLNNENIINNEYKTYYKSNFNNNNNNIRKLSKKKHITVKSNKTYNPQFKMSNSSINSSVKYNTKIDKEKINLNKDFDEIKISKKKINDFNNNKNLNKTNKKEEEEKKNLIKEMIIYNNEIFFCFDYEDALKYDLRNFLLMYWDYVKGGQIIINTFCYEIFLELRIIKIIFMFFTFSMGLFFNALFYTDDYISDIYSNNGILDFFSSLPKSIYSFILSAIINFFLEKLSNSKNKLIVLLKNETNKKKFKKICDEIITNLKKKLIVFFIIIFLLLLFFLYYITCFCAVYHNNQKFWFYGSLESIGMEMIWPFFTSLLVASLRYYSLKHKCKVLFKINECLNFFL